MDYAGITSRCRNCGGARKEHGPRKPWPCRTRLKETSWQPWTVAEFKAAAAAATVSAAVESEKTEI